MSKKVCILGTSNTLKEAPFDDKSFEFWALNDMFTILPEKIATRWFQMHSRSEIEKSSEPAHKGRPSACLDWCRTSQIPVYMQQAYADIPASVEYPLKEVNAHFEAVTGTPTNLYTNTVAYEIALAWHEGYEEIHVYGVDMAVGSEYTKERISVVSWLWFCMGQGIKVVLPEGCDLFKNYFLYGYDEEKESDLLVKARAKSAEMDRQSKEFMKNYYLSLGAKDTWDFILRELGK